MNPCSHPRLLNVFPHACRFLVSSQPRCLVSYLLSTHMTHYDHPSLLHPIFNAQHHAYLCFFLTSLHPIRTIQST
jgi:hypothetical protein